MKIKDAIQYLNEYEDKEQEIMIAWNDITILTIGNEQPDEKVWGRAVAIYDDASLEGFGDDCRWAVREAQDELESEEM
jgi:hypothetical protein